MKSNTSNELTIRHLTAIFRRRQIVIYSTVAAMAVMAVLYCVLATRRYEATGMIEVQSKNQDRLGLESITGGTADSDSDALAVNMEIQTQASILQSDTLALKTIQDLHMLNTADFRSHRSILGWFSTKSSTQKSTDSSENILEHSPGIRRQALSVFSSNLKVKPVPGTRLIQITFVSPDPALAAQVVNNLAQALISYSFQARFEATNQAADWLGGQLGDLRQQSEQLQRQVADLESKSGVYSLGTIDPRGRDQAYSGVLDQLQQATTALSQAEQNRILRGAILQAAESGDAEMLSGLAGNTTNGGAVNNSLGLIQSLRTQEGTEQGALQQAETKYGNAYPKLDEMRSNIDGLHHSVQQELGRLKERAKGDYDNATRNEAETRNQYDEIKGEADKLNNKSVDFAILRQEADESRKLYQELLERFKEAGVLESLKGSTITVVDAGRIPGAPKTPNVRVCIAGGIVGGFLLGCSIAFLLEAIDDKVRTLGQVERISGHHLLGATPLFFSKAAEAMHGGPPRVASLDDPQSRFVESARAIRTRICLTVGQKLSNVILVTSSVPGEGKTTIAVNLAILIAQASKRVLVVDTDLRLGSMQQALNLPIAPGLSELLEGRVSQPRISSVTDVPNLYALQSGRRPSHPSELLGSSSFEHWLSVWRNEYDYIVLDSAPILPVTDSLTLTPLSDITLLITRPGLTDESQLSRSYELLATAKPYVATIVNGLPPLAEGYSSYFGYQEQESKHNKMLEWKIEV